MKSLTLLDTGIEQTKNLLAVVFKQLQAAAEIPPAY